MRGALALAERGYTEWRSRPGSKPYWQFRLFKAEALLAQGNSKDALPLLETDLPRGDEFRELAARRLLHLGWARFLRAQLDSARRLLEQGLALAPDSKRSSVAAELETRRAAVLARLGDTTGAEGCLRRARAVAVLHKDAYLEASALGNFGFIFLNAGRYDEAVPWLEQAVRLADQVGARNLAAACAGNLGRCYYFLGDSEKTLRLLNYASQAAAQAGDDYRKANWLGALGDAYEQRGDLVRAIEHFQQALALTRQLNDDFNTAHWLDSLAHTLLRTGDLSQAARYNDQALALALRIRAPTLHIWAVLRQADILAAKKELAAAETAYRQVLASTSASQERQANFSAHAGLAAVLVQWRRWRPAEREFQASLDMLERSQSGMARDEWKLSFRTTTGKLYSDYIDYLVERGRFVRALEVAESARARVLAGKLAGAVPRPADAAQFRQAAGNSGAVLVSFWLSRRRSFAWVVRPNRIESFTLPPEAELETLVRAYRTAIDNLRDPLETANAAGQQLAEILLKPLAGRLPPSGRVVLVPDGCLHELNFETLPAGPNRYWIEEVTLAISPSLSLLEPQPAARRESAESLLLIGNPLPAAPEYPPLPQSAKEVAGIGARFSAQHKLVLEGAAAAPPAYRSAAPERFSLIHFSAHAAANPESPLDSAVILSPRGERFKLYAREVVGIPLRARLVTLSACRSAGARWYAGEGLVGFTWAFLQAGAHNVIAGLWDVNDDSTATLMQAVYAGMSAGHGAAPSLRNAKLALLRSGGAYRKPYYWASFQLFTRSCDF